MLDAPTWARAAVGDALLSWAGPSLGAGGGLAGMLAIAASLAGSDAVNILLDVAARGAGGLLESIEVDFGLVISIAFDGPGATAVYGAVAAARWFTYARAFRPPGCRTP